MSGGIWGLVDQLSDIRKASGLTFEQAAATAGIDKNTFLNWAKHRNTPRLTEFMAALNSLGYDLAIVPTTEASE